MIYLAIKLNKNRYIPYLFDEAGGWGGGGGDGVTKATIDIYHKYTNNSISSHSKHTQCILIVSQNMIINFVFGN